MDLSSANLSNADLSNADLMDTDLSDANLLSANLRGADLFDAYFDKNTTLPDGENWSEGTDVRQFTEPSD